MAPIYAAFLQNALMSGLFIAMLVSRGGMRGQSLTIAIGKFLGTLAPVVEFSGGSNLVLIIGSVIVVLDLTYIGLVAHIKRHGGVLGRDERSGGYRPVV